MLQLLLLAPLAFGSAARAVHPVGTPARPLRVAVVGAGPSGFYAADALLKQQGLNVEVDLFDRSAAPHGLVRSGLAPDHQQLKTTAGKMYEKTAENPRLRYFGNVEVGKDITDADLGKMFDHVIYAVGQPDSRPLGIPGETLEGSHQADGFIGWYNGNPDHQDGSRFDLSGANAVVIGVGNSAMDVARLLAQDPEKLKETDINPAALEALKRSGVKNVYLLARRGPAQAAFSLNEVKQMASLESADLVVRPEDMAEAGLPGERAKATVDFLKERSQAGEGAKDRKVRVMFFTSPKEILGEDGRVRGVTVERTRLVDDGKGGLKAEGTGAFLVIPTRLVFNVTGWKGRPIPGLPFDERRHRIPNDNGRVIDPANGPRWVSGWAKNGAVGLVGQQNADAQAVVKALLAEAALMPASEARDPQAVIDLLKERGVRYVTLGEWKALDALEKAAGQAVGAVRRKFTSLAAMLAALTR